MNALTRRQLAQATLATGLVIPSLAAASWCESGAVRRVGADDFRAGLAQWRLEAQDARAEVAARDGMLDVQTPAGVTLWWRERLSGDYRVSFTVTALPAPPTAGALAGRVSDLNMFWNATEPEGTEPRPRSGAFAAYDGLRLYYAGFGANGNRSTRLRRYTGTGQRLLLDGWADATEAEPADRQGAMTDATRLVAGEALAVELWSRAPTVGDPVHLRWFARGRELFNRADTAPLLSGWFGLRTTASRLQVRDFVIETCEAPKP